MVTICFRSFFIIALICKCRPIVSAPLLGHFVRNDYSSCCEGILVCYRILNSLIDVEGGLRCANNGSTDDLRRKSLSIVALLSSLFPQFIVSVEDPRDDGNYFCHQHCLDSSVFCGLFIVLASMDKDGLESQRSSDIRTGSRHNRYYDWFGYILSPDTDYLESTDASSTKAGHSCHLCDRVVVNMFDPNTSFYLLTPNSGIATSVIGLYNRVTLFRATDISYIGFIITLCRFVVDFTQLL